MDDGHIEVLAFDNRDLAQILSHTRSHKGRQLDTTLWREHSVGAAPKLLECSGVHSYFFGVWSADFYKVLIFGILW